MALEKANGKRAGSHSRSEVEWLRSMGVAENQYGWIKDRLPAPFANVRSSCWSGRLGRLKRLIDEAMLRNAIRQ
jgi:hypothetical protein